jgi:hypothetical protein
MKTKTEKRQEEQHRLYRQIMKVVSLDKAVAQFGEKDVKWAINRYLVSVRERARLLKKKADAEAALAEITKKL